MTDLLSRLSAATGPSRELDADLWEHFGMVDERHCRHWCSMDGRTDLTREMFIRTWAPEYTQSIDAALTLVPKGWDWNLSSANIAIICRDYNDDYSKVFWSQKPNEKRIGFEKAKGTVATPAIALVIACLKAKEDK